MSNQSIFRITRELSDIQKNTDLSIAVACRDSDIRNVRALIVGPPDTPYEFGFFEFSVKFPAEYPGKAPSVTATTTNGGRCRFNPNIYAGGKVHTWVNTAIDIENATDRFIRTWRGEPGEEWSSAQGLESILISIQSLMSANPYENEPGFETANGGDDKTNQKAYVAKIRHETLRIAVLQLLEDYLGIHSDGSVDELPVLEENTNRTEYDIEPVAPPFEPFKDLCKRRFLWYYESYMNSVLEAFNDIKPNQAFAIMPFEGGGNTMPGKFNYPEIKRRLELVLKVLFRETDYWVLEGAMQVKKETTLASMMERQFQQIVEDFKRNDQVTIDIELQKNNPFAWNITYFGRPMTNLDGGMFRMTVTFSIRFPEEQPRVIFHTEMFHHRISKQGILCYFPKRADDIKSHIEGIIEAIEETEPPYDPRTLVNPEASKLYWGSADDRKQYNRRLRRLVQQSTE